MTFFASLVALLAVAALLLQISRQAAAPYPAMLAAAGVGLALLPGAPPIDLDTHTALALFIAPVLVDAAFDFPLGAIRRYWRPLVALAVIAVLLTCGHAARRRAGGLADLCGAGPGGDRGAARSSAEARRRD